MVKERLKSPRARLFVALDLPDAVRAGIAAWGREELVDPALRPVRAESLHITLAFLGYLSEKEIPRLGEIVESSGGRAPSIELDDPVPRPERGRPRLFALPADFAGDDRTAGGAGARSWSRRACTSRRSVRSGRT